MLQKLLVFLAPIIKMAPYALIIVGLFTIFHSAFSYTFKEFMYKMKTNPGKKKKKSSMSSLEVHLGDIFAVIGSKDVNKSISKFYNTTILFFLVPFILILPVFKVKAPLYALLFAALPYAYIRFKMALVQRTGSFEGETVIREIRNQYKYNFENMISTIDSTVATLPEDCSMSKRVLFRLSLRLKTYQSDDDLKAILDSFVFSYGTRWARMLANNIYNAIGEKTNVSAGLEDLFDTCRQISGRIQKDKQGGVQAAAITKLLSPILFVAFYYIAGTMLGIKEVFRIQFTTEAGLLLFVVMIFITLANYAAGSLASKPKYDL